MGCSLVLWKQQSVAIMSDALQSCMNDDRLTRLTFVCGWREESFHGSISLWHLMRSRPNVWCFTLCDTQSRLLEWGVLCIWYNITKTYHKINVWVIFSIHSTMQSQDRSNLLHISIFILHFMHIPSKLKTRVKSLSNRSQNWLVFS